MIAPRHPQDRYVPQFALAPIAINNHQALTVISLGALLNKTTPEKFLGALLDRAAQELYEELAETMFGLMDADEIATALLGSAFGRNMLSLSSALIHLPFDSVGSDVRREVISRLPVTGHGPAETEFLGHMLEVRTSFEPEPALAECDRTFRAIVSAGAVSDEDIARAREVIEAATGVLDAVGVRTVVGTGRGGW